MVYSCAASSRLALPTVVRSIFTETASELQFSRAFNPLSVRHQFQSKRYFARSALCLSPESKPRSSPVKSSSDPKASNSTRTNDDRKPKMANRGDRDDNKPVQKKKIEKWEAQKNALNKKFKEGWNPTKKLSPDAIDGIRQLHAASPEQFTTPVLAEQFKISPEAIRRILKSKWRPSETELDDRRKRWQRRHDRIWSQMAELGLRPQTKRANPHSDSKVLYDNNDKE